ncbi:MAG TPA: hypothetical protein VGO58_02990, partial [Chitinophagaceae bacterium]|jgi:hypothetical protein|nr:hypothetical protein [Chitinophagaceae bacterium]
MIILQKKLSDLFFYFADVIESLSSIAADHMEESLEPEKDELKKNHSPHLALVFAFIRLFGRLQGELNKKTRQHLDFFYKKVLQIGAAGATPDKAHIVFELQKILRDELQKYPLPKGSLLKDGKDENKQEILFATDKEIVVNEAQVADKRTLYLNTEAINDKTYIEGVYMAPQAEKADGVKEDFRDDEPNNWHTLGNKFSKFIAPGKKDYKLYPDARIGFILASQVLYLAEGTREITIKLACKLDTGACSDAVASTKTKPYSPATLMPEVAKILSKSYILINEDILEAAKKKGLSEANAGSIKSEMKGEYLILFSQWTTFLTSHPGIKEETESMPELFNERHAFSIVFSGEKEWIKPSSIEPIVLAPPNNGAAFDLTIIAKLNADKPAVTFFNKEALKEDFNTELPVVKIELDPYFKLLYGFDDEKGNIKENCCLERPAAISDKVSLYHFFRAVKIEKATTISVKVCGVKNLVVQNDENVMDVNAPIYPFGTRPDVADFDVANAGKYNVITQELIQDAKTKGISANGETKLEDAKTSGKRMNKKEFPKFISEFTVADQIILNDLISTKNYSPYNLAGPNFYIGSKEIFFKAWENICVNLNWKDKPASFNDHYLGYLKRDDYFECSDPNDYTNPVYGLNECEFQVNLSLLNQGVWKKEIKHTLTAENPVTEDNNRELFSKDICVIDCKHESPFTHTFAIENTNFDDKEPFINFPAELKRYSVDARHGFLRFNLQNQDFLHKNYPFVLARQMMAFGKLPGHRQEGAVYYDQSTGPFVFETATLINDVAEILAIVNRIDVHTNGPIPLGIDMLAGTTGDIQQADADLIRDILRDIANTTEYYLAQVDSSNIGDAKLILEKITELQKKTNTTDSKVQAIIPNEPWTPIISNISLDYTATATITDLDLIHLYPYTGTYKHEEIRLQPSLFPVFCDEGNLFIGIKDLVPGSNLNMLFQLAEATANSEADKQDINWQYLTGNAWKPLRSGFEIIEDGSNGLTTSGIIEFAMPRDISTGNSILPKGLFWIKAAVALNSKTVSELINIHTQAIAATFTNTELNDKNRLSKPLAPGSIAKLNTADVNIKRVNQFYESFDGQVNEDEGPYYTRVSELLRHKGRAIQKWDYERLVLEKFPQLYKAKCINHSFHTDADKYKNDIPYAPGYVMLAVIPDLDKLRSGNSFEPKAPVNVLGDIEKYFRAITSPFVRLKAANPRYEKVHFSLTVQFSAGTDKIFYKEKLIMDLQKFLAPWAVGEYHKLSFGQVINRSDILRFLESVNYIDFISQLKMKHEGDPGDLTGLDSVSPKTPRSILIAGDIAVIPIENCEKWCKDPLTTNEPCNKPERVKFLFV